MQPPRRIEQDYNFEVKLKHKIPTTMHGSSEGHTAYIYKACRPDHTDSLEAPCDTLFAEGIALLRGPPSNLFADARKRLDKALEKTCSNARPVRACRQQSSTGRGAA